MSVRFGPAHGTVFTDSGTGVNEEARFEAFYETTRKPLYAYLYRILGDAALAQDLFQEAYLRLLKAEVTSLDEEARRRYLFRIAANLVKDHFRKQKRRQQYRDDSTAVAETSVDGKDQKACVTAALEALSPQNRSLLWLAYVEEYDHAKIGEILGLARGSVRVLLFRARQRMLQLLKPASANKERTE